MAEYAANEDVLRTDLVRTARRLHELNLSAAATGNVSVRCGQGYLVTPSGMDYQSVTADDLVWLDSDGSMPEGQRRPTSEWRMHVAIYQARPEFAAIVHTHSAHATALACLRREIPPFHYMVTKAGGDNIRCADYATFGTQALSNNALQALEDRRACLLANHGLIVAGTTLAAALQLAWEVEELARQYCLLLPLGEPVLLDSEELQRVSAQFADYGQKNQV